MRIINSRLKEITSKNNIEYIGKITTNGLNLTPKLYRELVTTFNMKGIEITIDGVSEYHDKRRTTKVGKPTFNAIFNNLVGIINSEDSIYDRDKSFISIRCNIDQRNFDGVVPLLDLLSKNGLHNKIFFYTANVFSWAQNGADKGFTIEEYANKCIDYLIYLEQRGFTLINLLPNRTPPVYCLATSENAEMYDAYGNIFDCSETSYSSIYENTELLLGNVNSLKNNPVKRSCLINHFENLRSGKILKCKECRFYPLCGGGCAKAMFENNPRCPAFIHNIGSRMLLDFVLKDKLTNKEEPNEIHSNVFL